MCNNSTSITALIYFVYHFLFKFLLTKNIFILILIHKSSVYVTNYMYNAILNAIKHFRYVIFFIIAIVPKISYEFHLFS